MACYIHYGTEEQDPTVQGAEWLCGVLEQLPEGEEKKEKFLERFNEIRSKHRYEAGDVLDLFVDHSEDLFGLASSASANPEAAKWKTEDRLKEIEGFFALVLSMLKELNETEALDKSTDRLCKLFGNSTEQQPELRLRMLMMLYNTFNDPLMKNRYGIFKCIVDYSAKAGLLESQVLPYLIYVDDWMADWEESKGMNKQQKCELFLDLSKYMRNLGQSKRADAFVYLKKYMQLFQGESEKACSEKVVQEATIQLIKDAVGLPSVIQFDDILAFDTVKALGKTQKSLIDLCKLFLNGDVKDLETFYKKNEKVFKDHDLDYSSAMAKMRLLTLATTVHGKSEITLAAVAKALDEKEDKVQEWVVRAVSEGVIDGRIDQLNDKVLVKSAFQREFGKKEWAFLDSKLTCWTDNLESVIKFIQEQKQIREASPAA